MAYDSDHELYELAACGLLSTRPNGIILRVNKLFCDWLGYSAEELIETKRVQDLLTVGCKIFHQTHWMPLLQIQGSVAEVQLDFVHRNGQAVPMLMNALARSGVHGASRHDLAVFVAADRRKYERELLFARKRAEELLERERVLAEQLIGIVSHDLRTPINAVLLGANLLAGKGVGDRQERIVKRITSAATRASGLVADLLDFTQARLGGGLHVAPQTLDLHELVGDCLEELKLAWPGRMIEHQRSGSGEAFADPHRIAQVVTNLVSNALTYGTAERPVRVSTRADEDRVKLEVHNEGKTIDPELLPHLFEPMRRGEQQVRLGSRSVGLGLFIVQQIARAHGGEVVVHSSAEAGTTFAVSLPKRTPDPTTPE